MESLINQGFGVVYSGILSTKKDSHRGIPSVLSLNFSGLGWVVDDTGIFSLTRYVALPLIMVNIATQ